MRQIFAIFTAIMIIGIANGASISLTPSVRTATLNQNVTVSYSASFSEGISGIVTLTAKSSDNNVTLVDAKEFNNSIEQDFVWQIGNTLAGTYELLLEVVPEGLSAQQASETITIEPVASLEVSVSELPILAFSGQKTNAIVIMNSGNVPLEVGPQFITTPSSDVGITPTTFSLVPGEARSVEVSVGVPKSDYDFTLRFRGEYSKNTLLFDSEDTLVRVYKPISDLKWEVEGFITEENFTVVPLNLSNQGNFEQELSFVVKTFSYEGIKTFNFDTRVDRETVSLINLTIPTEDKIYYIEMSYLDDSNSTSVQKRTFPVLFGFKAPEVLLNIIVAVSSNSTLRGIVLSAFVVIAISIFLKIVKNVFFKRRK